MVWTRVAGAGSAVDRYQRLGQVNPQGSVNRVRWGNKASGVTEPGGPLTRCGAAAAHVPDRAIYHFTTSKKQAGKQTIQVAGIFSRPAGGGEVRP